MLVYCLHLLQLYDFACLPHKYELALNQILMDPGSYNLRSEDCACSFSLMPLRCLLRPKECFARCPPLLMLVVFVYALVRHRGVRVEVHTACASSLNDNVGARFRGTTCR